MNSSRQVRKLLVFAVIGLACALAILFLIRIFVIPNNFWGHVRRKLQGESTVKQTVDGLANGLKQTPFVNDLQEWSAKTLNSYNLGAKIGENGATPNLPLKSIVVSRKAIPQFIADKWRSPPEIVILLATNGTADSVLIDWYNYGLVVGPKSYRLEDLPWEPYYSVTVQPGVFAIWVDSK
jgi:hypothetical protein